MPDPRARTPRPLGPVPVARIRFLGVTMPTEIAT